MKKIKFRQPLFYNEKFREWHYWGFLSEGHFAGPDMTEAAGFIEGALKNSEQFTGLKDKTGKEIYEGDILKIPVQINQDKHGNYALFEVLYRNGTWIKSYLKSERGFILPKGYLAGELLSDVSFDKEFYFMDNYFEDGIHQFEIVGNNYERENK